MINDVAQYVILERPSKNGASFNRAMMRLHDYLDFDKIKVITKEKKQFIGAPIVVNYADETASGEEELTIESDKIFGFAESEIESIEILDEIEG